MMRSPSVSEEVPPVPLESEGGWAPEPVWMLREKFLSVPGIEPQFLSCPAVV
jgi:hypothetical protein